MHLPNFFKKNDSVQEEVPKLVLQDIIAPGEVEVDFNNLRVDDRFFRTYFVSNYPRFVDANLL